MRITLLGTGTSQGVPLIGHPNEGLDLSEPKNWRNRSCAHIVSDDAHIQIDAGPEFRLACLKFRVDAVDFFFLTHGHSDHILGMDDLRRFCDLRGGAAIPVWTTPEGKARVEAIFPYGIRPRSERKSGRRIAYFTDCSEVPDEAVALARGADLLVIDALHRNPHPTHLNFEKALEASRKIRAALTVFTHMTYRADYARESAALPPGVRLGYDGFVWEDGVIPAN